MDKIKTGNLIREARTKKGLTQQELGDMVGVTNKAVSRWENGDAFPDVALLDTLSSTLGLEISEIVLGEKKDNAEGSLAIELVRLARMEKNRKGRKAAYIAASGIVCVALFFLGLNAMLNGHATWPSKHLYIAYFLLTLILTIFLIKQKVKVAGKTIKREMVFTALSVIGTVYVTALMFVTLALVSRGTNVFGLEDYELGPFLQWNVMITFVINAIVLLISLFEIFVNENRLSACIFTSLAGGALCLMYSNFLYSLISVDSYFEILLSNVGLIVGITLVAATVTYLCAHFETKKRP